MTYQRRINSAHPGCLVFLLDQSYSMREVMPSAGRRTKAQAVADAVNDLLDTVVRVCSKDFNAPPRHYYDIAVIGYGGEQADSLLRGTVDGQPLTSVVQIANAVTRHKLVDGIRSPVWFEPVADGQTPMCTALDLAGRIVYGWIEAHSDSFPPIVINITDGAGTDGDPDIWAQRIRSLHTDDGQVLLFTIHVSAGTHSPVIFPSSESQVPDEFGRKMFNLTSELPDFMRTDGLQADLGARGLVSNGDFDAVVYALRVGTPVERLTAQ